MRLDKKISEKSSLLIDGFFELLASVEFDNFAGRNGQGFAGLRIASLAFFTFGDREGSEIGQSQTFFTAQGIAYYFHKRIEDFFCYSLGQTGFGCDFLDEFGFCHELDQRNGP